MQKLILVALVISAFSMSAMANTSSPSSSTNTGTGTMMGSDASTGSSESGQMQMEGYDSSVNRGTGTSITPETPQEQNDSFHSVDQVPGDMETSPELRGTGTSAPNHIEEEEEK